MKTKNETENVSTKIENKLKSLLRDLTAREDLAYIETQMTELGYTTDRGVIKGLESCLEWLKLNPKRNSLKFVIVTKDESFKSIQISVSNYLEVIEELKQEERLNRHVKISVKEYRSLLGLYNSTKTLLSYQELQKETPIWEDMIDWSSGRIKEFVKEIDTYDE